MKAIAIATVNNICLPVLIKSIDQYVPKDVAIFIAGATYDIPDRKMYCFENSRETFGEAYNFIANKAFEHFDEIIVVNDDIVFNPTTYPLLKEDVEHLKKTCRLGWVVSKSDRVRGSQQFFNSPPNAIYEVPVASPLCGYISKSSWIDFPPINWYSDDIQCIDMAKNGCKHFVSRSYVHHVGSQTIGADDHKNHLEAEPWIKQNRKELHLEWFK